MSISFSCSQCGKDYVVSDGLAGKSAICKACGARMTVPGAAAVAAGDVPAPADAYGLDDPPPAAPPPADPMGSPLSASPVPKKFGSPTYTPSKPPRSGGGIGRFIGLAVVIGFMVLGAIGRMGLSSKSEVRAFHQKQFELGEQFVAGLKGIKDVASAKAASGPIRNTLQQMTENLEKNGRKKGRKNDVDSVAAEYKPKNAMLEQQVMAEMMRVAMIPGALDALDINEPLERLSKLETSIGQEADKKK